MLIKDLQPTQSMQIMDVDLLGNIMLYKMDYMTLHIHINQIEHVNGILLT